MSTKETTCLCGSNKPFVSCCEKVLNNHAMAKTAEMLMRSRYTAYILKHDPHILCSWDVKTRPKTESLNHSDHPVSWLGLKVHNCTDGTENDVSGTVEFTASYIENGMVCRLTELARFNKIDGLWFYLNGQCNVEKEKMGRNNPCPCGSGKKFKRCCVSL